MPSSRTVAQAREQVHAAVVAHLNAAGEDPNLVAWDNLPADIEGRDFVIRFTMLHVSGTLAALGQTYYRRRVNIVFGIWTREGTGRARSDALIETAISFFETLDLEGFSLVIGPQVVDTTVAQGFLQVNVNAQFDYETART